MPRFMKKNGIGLMVEAPDGEGDFDVTEVRMTKLEYTQLKAQIDAANNEKRRIEYESKKNQEALRKDTDQRLRKAKEDAENEKNELLIRLQNQENLNRNLKRIARERANVQRGLKPKKKHTGYLVLYSQQYEQRYERNKTAKVWKTVLQTPYDASLPLNQIKNDIWNELMHKVLYNLGFRQVQDDNKNGDYRIWIQRDENGYTREICGLYKWVFKANYRSGFWEMDLYHTKSIKVPEEYRPVRRDI